MIYTAIDNFYVSEEDLVNNTPSRKDGVSFETETQLRIYGCELIQEGGILLKLPQAVMATGQVLLHRFYCKESLLKFNIKVGCCLASAALLGLARVARSWSMTARQLKASSQVGVHVYNSKHYVLTLGKLSSVTMMAWGRRN